MTDIPTNGDIFGMIALLLILLAGLIFINCYADSSKHIDDLDAWNRNYDKLQRRHK